MEPLLVSVEYGTLLNIESALQISLERVKESLVEHEEKFGNSTRKNKLTSQGFERDILLLTGTLNEVSGIIGKMGSIP
jgi:hypothetical protein